MNSFRRVRTTFMALVVLMTPTLATSAFFEGVASATSSVSNVTVGVSSTVAGDTTANYTISFTTNNAILSTDSVYVTFPAGIVVSGVSFVSMTSCGVMPPPSVTPSGQQVTVLLNPTSCTGVNALSSATLVLTGLSASAGAYLASSFSVATTQDTTPVFASASDFTMTAGTTYNVTYDANTGSGTPPTDSTNYASGQTVTVIFGPSISLTNYTFTGWCDVQPTPGVTCASVSGNFYSDTGNLTFAMPAAPVTLYAVWAMAAATPTISGVNPSSGVALASNTITLTGTNFGSSASGVTSITYGTSGTGSTCTAVTYFSSTELGCTTGTNVTAGEIVTFIVTINNVASAASAQTFTGYAGERVTYNANTSSSSVPVDSTTYINGDTVSVNFTPPPTLTGYNFAGWCDLLPSVGTSCAGTLYTATGTSNFTMGTSNVTLYATWTPLTPTIATVSPSYTLANTQTVVTLTGTNFGSSASGVTSITYGTSGTGSTCTAVTYFSSTELGCTTGTNVTAGEIVTFIVTINNVASAASAQTFTGYAGERVTYNANTGSGAPTDSALYVQGDTVQVNLTTTPTLSGYTFTGWCTNAPTPGTTCSGSFFATGATTSFVIGTSNVTLYATWSAPVPSIYSLDPTTGFAGTFSSIYLTGLNFGTDPLVFSITYGPTGTESPCLTVAFISVNSAACEIGTNVTAGEIVKFIVTVNGQASLASAATFTGVAGFRVTYNANTGSGSVPTDSAVYVSGQGVSVAFGTLPTLSSYTFTGWCTQPTTPGATCASVSGTLYSSGGISIFGMGTSNVTLYATWQAVAPRAPSSIRLDSPDTNVAPSSKVTVGIFLSTSGSGTVEFFVSTGTMNVMVADLTVTSGHLANSQLSITAPSTPGQFTIQAIYSGDVTNTTATGSLTFNVAALVSCDNGLVLSSDQSTCVAAPGYFLAAGATSAQPCAAGSFSASLGATLCTPAPKGTYVNTTSATSAAPCVAGTYNPTPGAQACSDAPSGTYVASTGASQTTACPIGTTTPKGTVGARAKKACSVVELLITSRSAKSATEGKSFLFRVRATGSPLPTISESGTLPSGVSFTSTRPGVATLSGTPGAGSSGAYVLTFTAKNSGGHDTQTFELSVDAPPSITSASSSTTDGAGPANLTITPLNFVVKTAGYPVATISTASFLPDGITLVDNQNGTATLEGTPTADSGGTYPITFSATNSVGSTSQSFTLTVPNVDVYSLNSGGLCFVGDGTTTLLDCPSKGIPSLSIGFVCNVQQCGGTLLSDSTCPQGTLSAPSISAGMTGVITNCVIPSSRVTSGSVGLVSIDLQQGGKSQPGPSLAWRSNVAATILPPVITSLDSSTCLGKTLSGNTTVGLTACPAQGSSILINGKNFFDTTTVTPGLCSSLFYVTFFQLLCLLNTQPPGTVTNVQVFTPGMNKSLPTGFSVETLGTPTILSLLDSACTGTSVGLALSGCPSVGGSILTVKVNGTAIPSATLTPGLCSNIVWKDSNTLACTLSSGIAPGTAINVAITEMSGASTTTATISF